MRSMKKDSVTRLAILATIVAGFAFAVTPTQAQDTAAPAAAAPAADTTPPSTTDLEKRIDELEKELTALKSQVAPAPAAPAAPSIPSLLGPVTLSGFVDGYYGYNSNQPANRTTALRNFDINSDQFSLNMIELIADKAPDPAASHAGFHISLGFGEAMNLVNSTETGSPNAPTTPVGGPVVSNFDQYLKEGYLEYLIGKKLQINVGKFVTWNGAEVIESKDNWNYSRGLLFSWAIPYFHFGASAKYAFNSKFSLTGYLVNGWNNSVDNNSGKTVGFSAAWTPNAKWSLIQNYTAGPEHTNDNSNFRNLLDTIITYTPNAKLSLMANYDYGSDRFVLTSTAPFVLGTKAHWDGIAGYIKYAPNANWYIATRGEYFQDVGGFATGTSQNVGEFTLTLQRMLATKIMSRLEYRYDASNENVFPDNNGLPKSDQSTLTLGLIYAFSSADAPK